MLSAESAAYIYFPPINYSTNFHMVIMPSIQDLKIFFGHLLPGLTPPGRDMTFFQNLGKGRTAKSLRGIPHTPGNLGQSLNRN
jgi:hypothetical protein